MNDIERYVRSIKWDKNTHPYHIFRRLKALASKGYGNPIVRKFPLSRIKIATKLKYHEMVVTFLKEPVIVFPSVPGGRKDNFSRRTIYGRLLPHPHRVRYYTRNYNPQDHILVELIMWIGPRKSLDEEREY